MAILPILEVPDPRLKTVSEPVTEFDDALKTLIADMFETMYDAPGIGLAAIQVGAPKRILVIDLQEPVENEHDHDHEHGEHCHHEHEVIRDPRVFINPEILDPSEDFNVYSEGCLSVPDQYADVERPASITARWQDENGKQYEEKIEGLLATCLQHEMDHLEGILFIDHLSRLKRQMVLKKLAKLRKEHGIAA
ncbi:peptide deformylase [Parasphingorhabdus sp.]|jgi:peptide deformylase|uniref:peptide deformylase n=1 Tax=Parasphingorhabdus sp. TaxID=2709688 RepID=UPI00300328BE